MPAIIRIFGKRSDTYAVVECVVTDDSSFGSRSPIGKEVQLILERCTQYGFRLINNCYAVFPKGEKVVMTFETPKIAFTTKEAAKNWECDQGSEDWNWYQILREPKTDNT